jgi:hypothetical protein
MHQRGSIGVKNPRPHCSSQRMAYQEEVTSCNNLCRPLQFTIKCIPAKVNEHRRDIGGKDIIREICRETRSQSSRVPSGQRKIHGDDLHASEQGCGSDNYLLWRQRTLSERSGRREDQESRRSDQDNVDTCPTPLTGQPQSTLTLLIHAQHH